MKRVLFALAMLAACGNDFDPKSSITGIRVLGVKVDTPYAKPASKPTLSMLYADGTSDRVVRDPKIVWFHGCTNPNGGLYHQCYPGLSQRLGQAFQGHAQIIDKEVPGLVTLGHTTTTDVPADALAGKPQGKVFVFFAVCGGDVSYDPNPPNSSGLPIRCTKNGEDLSADEFVYGYTPLFVFDKLTNANPVIDGLTFGGNAPATKTCAEGCPADHACSGSRCLPVVPLCTASSETDCPQVAFKPLVARASVEDDPLNQSQESLWVEYAALNGRFDSGTRVVNDPSHGWNDDSEGKFVTFKAHPGEATLFAVVRDNRGGQAWISFDVIVQ